MCFRAVRGTRSSRCWFGSTGARHGRIRAFASAPDFKGDDAFGGGATRPDASDVPAVSSVGGAPPQRPEREPPLTSGANPSAAQVVEDLSIGDQESLPRFQKPFVDRLWLEAKAGNGGNPLPNAVRSPSLKGPGFGGNGGSVFFKATHLIESFLDVPQILSAEHGGDGIDTHRGMHAKDYVAQVPIGTIVRERVWSGERTPEGRRIYLPRFVYQFLRADDTYVCAKGGLGGVGPQSFKKRDGRVGTPGQRVKMELELRLLNDCALVGMPNAGKTALLAAMTRAHTRIGPEEYSTTRPHVGVLTYGDRVEVRMCDLPGLRLGAHLDKDMGRRVLRHTYRSRMLCFVVDVARGDRSEMDTVEEVEMLRKEAIEFDPLNRDKPWMVVGTKCDKLHKDALFHLDSLHFRLRARHGVEIPVIGTSARFGLGLTRFARTVRQLIYPELLEPVRRVAAESNVYGITKSPWNNNWLPPPLHGPFNWPLPQLGGGTRPLLLARNKTDGLRANESLLLARDSSGGSRADE